MSLTNDQINAIPDYTDAQLLKMYRKAMMDLAVGGKSHAINGRTLTRADEKFVRDTIEWLEGRVAEIAGDDNTSSLAVFRGPYGR